MLKFIISLIKINPTITLSKIKKKFIIKLIYQYRIYFIL